VTVALVLAGGFGKRLRPYTLEVPKILLPLGSKTIAEYLIDWLRYYGVNEIFMLVGYLKEKIIEALGSGARYGVYVSYIVEDEPLGTGGALRNASHIIGRMEKVIAVNGDIITNLDPIKLLQTLEDNIVASIASVPLRSPYGILDIEDGRVKGFREKPTLRDYWVNAGVYALKKDIIEYLPEKGDIERSTFPLLASRGQLAVVKYETPPYYWRSIDSPKDLEDIPRELEEIGGLLASLESTKPRIKGEDTLDRTVYTIGHSNRSFQELLEILKAHNVKILVDVRRFPKSRRVPWTESSKLKEHLEREGISYTWLGDLLGGFRSGGYKAYTETEDYKKRPRKAHYHNKREPRTSSPNVQREAMAQMP